MAWKLRKEENEFQVTREGVFEYHTFRHSEVYALIPKEDQNKFEEVKEE